MTRTRFDGATPGPWEYSRELGVLEIAPAGDDAPIAFCFSAPTSEGRFDAEYFTENVSKTKFPPLSQQFLNADLLAAAPDLLALAVQLVEALEWARSGTLKQATATERLNAALAAAHALLDPKEGK